MKTAKLNNAYRDAAQKANFYSTMIMSVAGNLMNISYALTAAFGGPMSILQGFDLGGLVVYLNYSRQVGQLLNQISQQMTTLLSAMAGAERIFEVMDTAAEVNEGSVTLIPAEKDANGTLSPFTGQGRPRTWAWKVPGATAWNWSPFLWGRTRPSPRLPTRSPSPTRPCWPTTARPGSTPAPTGRCPST